MFFYTSLFVASLIVALVVLWLYKALLDVGRAVYRAMLPSSKNNITSHAKESAVHITVNEARTPWGWKGNATKANVARTYAALPEKLTPTAELIPWGWPGHKHKIREYSVKEGIPLKPVTGSGLGSGSAGGRLAKVLNHQIDWPSREEEFEFAGCSYKVTRKVKPGRTNLKNTAKPWGW